MPSNYLILCHPLLLPPLIFPSIRVFSNESAFHIRWPKYWSFSFNISPSNEYSGLISFRMDWLDLLAAQGTLKSLLQHHSSEASILCCSAFFIVQLSHPYMTTGKSIALTRWTFVGKVISLFLNILSRLIITFLPRSKHLLISWLQSPSAAAPQPLLYRMHANFPCLVHSPLLRGGSSLIQSQDLLVKIPSCSLVFSQSRCNHPIPFLPTTLKCPFRRICWVTATFQHCAKSQENGDNLKTKIQLPKVSQLQRERHTTRDCFNLQNKYILRNLNFKVRAISSHWDFAHRDD